jgi:folylpolyglutamate synthase/dihydropteroate synthase
MICEYKKFVDYAFITQSTNTYSLKFDELSNKFKDYDILNTACENINEAMKLAILKSKDKDAILIVSGSSYIISDVRRNINL